MDTSLLTKLAGLDELVHDLAREFHNSTPVATYAVEPLHQPQGIPGGVWEVSYDLKDALLIAAITETPVLMVGATDTGKTTLAKLVLNALFGVENEGWAKLDVDTEFSQESLARTDFSALTQGRTSEQLYTVLPALQLPGLIIDEMNRTDPRLTAKLLHVVLEKEVGIGSSKGYLGAKSKGESRYQLQICAINESYKGTFDMDEALRRRVVMELPLDMFPPSMLDKSRMHRNPQRNIPLTGKDSHLDDVVSIKDAASQLKLSGEAEHFLLYLEAMESCVYSPTLTKGGFQSQTGISLKQYCVRAGQGGITCRFLNTYANEMCPNVRGLSSGVSKNLILLAQGFATMRAAKVFARLQQLQEEGHATGLEDAFESVSKNLQVETGDLMAAVPFVGYSKMGISNEWVGKEFKTSRWHAIKGVVDIAYQRFRRFYMQNTETLQLVTRLERGDVVKLMEGAFQEDHFMYFALLPYFAERVPEVTKIAER